MNDGKYRIAILYRTATKPVKTEQCTVDGKPGLRLVEPQPGEALRCMEWRELEPGRVPAQLVDCEIRAALVKISNGQEVDAEEPTFFLRARDEHSVAAISFYRNLCEDEGCNEYHLNGCDAALVRFKEWRAVHYDKLKQPGCTRGL